MNKSKVYELCDTKENILKRFMQEFFPFNEFLKVGFFKKEMKGDYQAQADRVCKFFGYKSVFEYGAEKIRCHISKAKYEKEDKFVEEIGNIYQ